MTKKKNAKNTELLEKLAEDGDAVAAKSLGDAFYNGAGVKKSLTDAVYWYLKAADGGSVEAEECLGMCYDAGEGLETNYEEAVKWFTLAASHGNAAAMGLDCAISTGTEFRKTKSRR